MNLTTKKIRRELATPKLTIVVGKFILSTAMLSLLGLLLLRGCDIALKKQAQADYEQCLSWQAEDYAVRCIKG